ncbi:MAG: glycosyltransferase [Elusimicrobia bacterium]|nr:glycosyltransferase [Elusimicrobiota bacterium]
MTLAAAATALEAVLAVHAAAMTAALLACVAASASFFRRDTGRGPVDPFTVIKPLRGAEAGLEDRLRSLLEADEQGVLQVLFAVESADDPAYAAAARVAAEYPKRDARVVVTGPSGARMGKMHNLIEAYKHARHAAVVFSDSDVATDRALLVETTRALRAGAGAASAIPDASGARRAADVLVGVVFNHYFCAPCALLYKLGLVTAFAGSWMAFTKETIARIGGLERYERAAADDFSMGLAAQVLGAKTVLLPRQAALFERGGSLVETARHMLKWLKVGRWSAPPVYAALPLINGLLSACALCLLHAARFGELGWTARLLAGTAFARAVGAWVYDLACSGRRFPSWAYPAIPVLDVAGMALWAIGLFADTIEWRGKTYIILPGGSLEVVRTKTD